MKKYWVWLSSLNKISPSTRYKLLNFFGSPRNIWGATNVELKESRLLTKEAINQIIDKNHKYDMLRQLKRLDEIGINLITIEDENYPFHLKQIYDPPVVLYVKGNLMQDEKSISIVGSRRATSYGLESGEELAYRLSKLGITITSGMARGIDTSAHKGALKANGRTIAVLGCGHDIVYPPENKLLMEHIIKTGAVISEYLPGTIPLARNFPARNRIISGISLGVVVVEAGEKSGSLITANFALEQGREVFALPGNINRNNSLGTNKLIKEGAKITTCVEDILEELKIYNLIGKCELDNIDKDNDRNENENKKGYGSNHKKDYKDLGSEEIHIIECLKYEPTHIDELANATDCSSKHINSLLTILELKGIVEQMPGKIFKLKRN